MHSNVSRRRPTWAAAPILLACALAPPVAADGVSGAAGADDPQLARLVEAVLEDNTALAALRAEARADARRPDAVRALPDPEVAWRLFLAPPETRVGPQRQSVELMQRLPAPGKRRLDGERAARRADARQAAALDAARERIFELKHAYWEAGYLQEALETNREESEILRRFEQSALKRYATGEGIQQSVLKVQTELTRLVDERIALTRRLASRERAIAELIGRPGEPLSLEPIALREPPAPPEIATLVAAAREGHPAIRGARARAEAERLAIERRRRDGIPDLIVGLGWTQVDGREDPAGRAMPPRGNGDDVLSAMVRFNVPIFSRRLDAGVAEAELRHDAARAEQRRLADRLNYRLEDAALRFDSAIERAQLHRDVLLPQAGEALASAEAAYTTNRLGFLDLLDAQRVLFRLRLAHLRLIADAWIARAELERDADFDEVTR